MKDESDQPVDSGQALLIFTSMARKSGEKQTAGQQRKAREKKKKN
jgi:hypothetical protein